MSNPRQYQPLLNAAEGIEEGEISSPDVSAPRKWGSITHRRHHHQASKEEKEHMKHFEVLTVLQYTILFILTYL